jgi:hypothetical protein
VGEKDQVLGPGGKTREIKRQQTSRDEQKKGDKKDG